MPVPITPGTWLTGAEDIADPERLGSFPRVNQNEENCMKVKYT